MENRFFAVTGNEFGVHMDESIQLVSREEALETYIRYAEEYGCASLYEVRDGEIVRTNQESEF